MNVLQLAKYYPPVYGGIELVEKMMTRAHRDSGDHVFICAFSNESQSSVGEFQEKITLIKEKINLLSAPFSWDYFWSFKKFVIENNIQRIYVHLPNPFMHEVVLRNKKFLKKRKVDVVAVYHSDIVNKSFAGDLYNFYFLNSSDVYDKFLVSSNELWNSSTVLSKIPDSKKRVIPFCIEEEERSSKPQHEFRGKIISIGRLVPYKGFDFLIQAMNNTEYELHIVGDGPMKKKLTEIAGKNIFFHHKLSHAEKNKLLSDADLMLIGSVNRAEAYGMTIVEAFSLGIPVVAPYLGTGVNFLVKEDKTGAVYQVKNAEELKDKIARFKSDPDHYAAISNSCFKFYNEYLTYDKFKMSLLKI